jgi:hypothetical protein
MPASSPVSPSSSGARIFARRGPLTQSYPKWGLFHFGNPKFAPRVIAGGSLEGWPPLPKARR